MLRLCHEVIHQGCSSGQASRLSPTQRILQVANDVWLDAAVTEDRTALVTQAVIRASGNSLRAAPSPDRRRRVAFLDDDDSGDFEGGRRVFWTPARCARAKHALQLAPCEGQITAVELVGDEWSEQQQHAEARRVHLLVGTSTGCLLWCSAVSGTVVGVAGLSVDVAAKVFTPSDEPMSPHGVVQLLVSRGTGGPSSRSAKSTSFSVIVLFSNGSVIEVGSEAAEQVSSLLALSDEIAARAASAEGAEATALRPMLRDWDPQTSTAPFPVAGPASAALIAAVSARTILSLPQNMTIYSCSLCARFSPSILEVFDSNPDSDKTVLVVGASPAFSSFRLHRTVATLSATQVVVEVAARITGAALGLVKGLWRGTAGAVAAAPKAIPKALPLCTLQPAGTIFPADVTFLSVDVDPSDSYAACLSGTGRIFIIDLLSGSVWKIFKGCRSAQFQWLVGAADAKSMLCLAILLPLRRILEVYALQTRTRVAAVAFKASCAMVPRTALAEDRSSLHMRHDDGTLTRWHVRVAETAAPPIEGGVKPLVTAGLLDTSCNDFEEKFQSTLKNCATAEQVFALLLSIPLKTGASLLADPAKIAGAHEAAVLHVRREFVPSTADPVVLHSVDQKPKTASQVLNFLQLRRSLLAALFDISLNGPPVKTAPRPATPSSSQDSTTSPSTSSFWLTSSFLSSSPLAPSGCRSSAALALRLKKPLGALTSQTSTLDVVAQAELRRVISGVADLQLPTALSEETCTPEEFETVVGFFWSGGHKNRLMTEAVHRSDDNVVLLARLLRLSTNGIEGLPALAKSFSTLGVTSAQAAQVAVHWACISDPRTAFSVSSEKGADTFCGVLNLLSAEEVAHVLLPLRLDLFQPDACLNRLQAAIVFVTLRLDSAVSSSPVSRPKSDLVRLLARLVHLAHFVRSALGSLQEAVKSRGGGAAAFALADILPYGKESFVSFLLREVWPAGSSWPLQLAQPLECPSRPFLAVLAAAEAVIVLPAGQQADAHVGPLVSGDAVLAALRSAKEVVFADYEHKVWNRGPGSKNPAAELTFLCFCSVVIAASHYLRGPALRMLRDITASHPERSDVEVALVRHLAGYIQTNSAEGRSRIAGKYLKNVRDMCELEIEVLSLALAQSAGDGGAALARAKETIAAFAATDGAESLFPVCSQRLIHAAAHLDFVLPSEAETAVSGGASLFSSISSSFKNVVMEKLFERRTLVQMLQWNLQQPGVYVDWAQIFSPAALCLTLPLPSTALSPTLVSEHRERFVKNFCAATPPPSREDAEGLRVLLGVGTSDLVTLELLERAAAAGNTSEVQQRAIAVSNRSALGKVALRILHDVCRVVLKEILGASARLQQQQQQSTTAAADRAARAARVQAAGLAQRVEGALTGPVLQWVRSRAPLGGGAGGAGAAAAVDASNRTLVAGVRAAIAGGAASAEQLSAYLNTSQVLAGYCAAEATTLGDALLAEIALEMPSVVRSIAKIISAPF